ncbi:MAG: cytochrome c [Desulfobacteraceae bacterium]|jgi:hypothetical protein
MTRILILGLIVTVVLGSVYAVITIYDENLQIGRMWETPAVRPHETPIPAMADGIVPFNGGEVFYHTTTSNNLLSPIDLKNNKVITLGKTAYVNYCIHCHGKYFDGNGTVGQSFIPPPGDLRSTRVQKELTPGALFHEISFGLPDGRQPPLATTVSVEDRWRVIAYVKSLGLRK